MLPGKEKVAIEWGLLAIAQNIRKKVAVAIALAPEGDLIV
jgi:hypothetical protein